MGRLLFKDKPLVGLDISQTSLKLMALNRQKNIVEAYGSIDLEPAKVEESLQGGSDFLETNLQALLQKNVMGSLPSSHVIISIPTAKTYTRTFSLPASTKTSLKDAVSLEIDQYIPLPADTLYIDYEVVSESKEEIIVVLNAVPRVFVDRCLEIADSAGLQPLAVEPSINSVARLLKTTEKGHLSTVIIDIGPAGTDIAVLDTSVKITGSVNVGGNTFTLDIARHLKVSLENAHQLKVLSGLASGPRQKRLEAALHPSLNRILDETRKVIRYYNERLAQNNEKLEQVLIVGGGSNLPGIGEFFTNSLVMPARVASPWQELNFGNLKEPIKQFRPRYITVAGLASVKPEEVWE